MLRKLIESGNTIVAPGATDALSARLIEAHGFDCVYIGSYATAASRFGLPDTGLLSLDELVGQAKTIVDAVKIPVIADAEGGFHDAPNIWRTVQAFEHAGVAAIHIEDHSGTGKHTSAPQSLRPRGAMAARIRAAVDARKSPEFMIIARSDAFWVSRDLDDCIARLKAYADAGADMVFPSGVGPAELDEVRRRIGKPLMIIDIPGQNLEQHRAASIVLYYAFSALVQFEALSSALQSFKSGKRPASQQVFEDFLGYGEFTERAANYYK
jgi:2-methylisocitrate lyase-like PEP mutase family enzyme